MNEEDIKQAEDNSDTADETSAEAFVYELGYHVISTVEEGKVAEEVAGLKDLMSAHGGMFISEEHPVMTRLAYTIVRKVEGKREKYDTAYFGWMKFELPMGAANALTKELEKNANILRFLIVKTVREDTRAPKRTTQPQREEVSAPKETARTPAPTASAKSDEKEAKPASEEDLDRTIEELVVE